MKVYIVYEDAPADWGESGKVILSVHQSAIGADARIKKLKASDEYVYQYLTRMDMEVEN